MKKKIRIGSRDSVLAMWQTRFVIEQLQQVTDAYEFEIISAENEGRIKSWCFSG